MPKQVGKTADLRSFEREKPSISLKNHANSYEMALMLGSFRSQVRSCLLLIFCENLLPRGDFPRYGAARRRKGVSMRDKVVATLNLEPPVLRQVGFKLAKVDGINLAQGLCIMPTPPQLIEAATAAMKSGHNRYSAAQGIVELRSAIAKRLVSFNRITNATEDCVVVTAGSTGAFEAICQTFLRPGDEVVSFTPFYPYHHNALLRSQVKLRYVELKRPSWEIDFDTLEKSFSPKTKFLLLTTPNNPTGKMFTRAELERIATLCRQHGVFCVTDEVYEYITSPGYEHVSMASLPEMFEHTITMSSYSKTFAITGWRIGFLAAPPAIADILKVTFDQLYVCAPTPLQHAVAAGVANFGPEYYQTLKADYDRKREILVAGLSRAGLSPNIPQGAYYVIADTTKRFPGVSSEAVVDTMIQNVGVGAVPAIDFIGTEYKGNPARSNFLRFSYAVPDEMLERAVAQLQKL